MCPSLQQFSQTCNDILNRIMSETLTEAALRTLSSSSYVKLIPFRQQVPQQFSRENWKKGDILGRNYSQGKDQFLSSMGKWLIVVEIQLTECIPASQEKMVENVTQKII